MRFNVTSRQPVKGESFKYAAKKSDLCTLLGDNLVEEKKGNLQTIFSLDESGWRSCCGGGVRGPVGEVAVLLEEEVVDHERRSEEHRLHLQW